MFDRRRAETGPGSPTRVQRNPAAADRPSVAAPAASILRLQRQAGNSAVSGLLAPAAPAQLESAESAGGSTTHEAGLIQTTLSAAIPRRQEPAARAPHYVGAPADHDSPDEATPDLTDPGAVSSALSAQVSTPANEEPGKSVTLPDMVVPPELVVAEQDSIAATITYAGSVTQSGSVSPFGATTWNNFTVSGITVTPSPGAFTATFTLTNPITFNVAAGGRTDIPSESAAAITHANFPRVASDLTPNMSSDGGRPPRTQFWAQDLTVRHENFHATERRGFAATGAQQAQTWLSGQTATSAAEVGALIAQVPGRVIASSQAAAGDVHTKESRAYGDGAPLYQARADAIRARGALGANGGYPGAPAPPPGSGGTP